MSVQQQGEKPSNQKLENRVRVSQTTSEEKQNKNQTCSEKTLYVCFVVCLIVNCSLNSFEGIYHINRKLLSFTRRPLMIGTLNKVSKRYSILNDAANMTPSPMLKTPLLICIA